jgi:hypothetical protein
MSIKANCTGTAIGSLPHKDPAKAVDVVLASIPDAPIWPQLSSTGMNEQMEIQYSEGLPSHVIDRTKGRMYFDTSVDYSEAFAEFYEKYMAAMEEGGDLSFMAISPEFSKGIYELEKRLKGLGKKLPFVKVQTTGPCSFALTLVDENKRAMYYNEEFRDVIVKALALKCRWQIQKFSPYAENVICFIDEPILSAFGSSTYVSVQRQDVVTIINEVIEAVHMDGGLAGIHCCGNTEWSILVDAGVDILNFDAFAYGETIAMYPDHMKTLINRGGMLAWGVVPTSVAIREQTVDTLVAQFEKVLNNLLAKTGLDKKKVLEQSFITPSCGTGSMQVEDAEKVFSLLGQLSKTLKKNFGF